MTVPCICTNAVRDEACEKAVEIEEEGDSSNSYCELLITSIEVEGLSDLQDRADDIPREEHPIILFRKSQFRVGGW